jgi:hypothetical protein
MDWTGLATLAAAVAAAILSGVSLFLSGRREDRRWKREVLVDTMVSLFDASFNSLDTATLDAREAGEDLEWHRDRCLSAHAVELQALTRLRFLAKPEVVERAFELHNIEDELYEAVFKKDVHVDAAQWHELLDRRRVARTNLFNASRRNLGLRRTLPVAPTIEVGPTGQEMIDYMRKRQTSSNSGAVGN